MKEMKTFDVLEMKMVIDYKNKDEEKEIFI
jgi:hypothetical protein